MEATNSKNAPLRVYVVGGGYMYIKMFSDAGFKGARNVEEADILCFTGGEDVDPKLYGETPLPQTYFNTKRDEFEAGLFGEALALKKPMVGICRGAQLLNVMSGGRLWQDVNNHARTGTHPVVDMRDGTTIYGMTSTHHQQMIPNEKAEVIAMADLSTLKKRDGEEIDRNSPSLDDVEVVWYPESNSLCFQPHPEYQAGACQEYFKNLMNEYVIPAC